MELMICRTSLPSFEIHTFGFYIDDIFSRPNRREVAHVYRDPFTGEVVFEDRIDKQIIETKVTTRTMDDMFFKEASS